MSGFDPMWQEHSTSEEIVMRYFVNHFNTFTNSASPLVTDEFQFQEITKQYIGL